MSTRTDTSLIVESGCLTLDIIRLTFSHVVFLVPHLDKISPCGVSSAFSGLYPNDNSQVAFLCPKYELVHSHRDYPLVDVYITMENNHF